MKLKEMLFYLSLMWFSLCTSNAMAQVPVGQWQNYGTYFSEKTITKIGDKIYVAGQNMYAYSTSENDYTYYSKVNGLSDVNISLIRYDEETKYMIVIYTNSNIDLFKDGNFINISSIKNSNVTGSKRINDVFFKNNLMYLSTDFGVVVLNPERQEIKETYTLQQGSLILKVHALASFNNQFYAATSKGLYRADELNPNLQNYASWTAMSSSNVDYVFLHLGNLFCANHDSVFNILGTSFTTTYVSKAPIERIVTGSNDIYLCERNDSRRAIMTLNQNGIVIDSVFQLNPFDVVEITSNEIWVADDWGGLIKLSNRKDQTKYNPSGITSNSLYNVSIYNNDVYVSAGGPADPWQVGYNSGGISKLSGGNWTYYNRFVGIHAMDSVYDITSVTIDKRNAYLYASSYGGGLLELHPDNTTKVYKQGFIEGQIGNEGAYLVVDLQFDQSNNLWMSNYSAPNQLVVKKADGTWQRFSFPYSAAEKSASQLVIDDANQVWMVAPRGIGIYVLNHNNTIDNKNDDQIRFLRTGTGYGNLPNNEVNCIAKDKNGKIWVGTADGIGIFNCPESIATTAGCDGELKIVKYDLNAGLLFQRENIKTIAIDGANNKWIGTNNGVWLISDDAEKIIHRFTKENSPLPANEVTKIAVHPNTGEVFIATAAGLVSYRGEATDGDKTNDGLVVFPNPVPSNYGGMISIKGLVENADVRITDVAGQLVYRCKAQGGQATWNGKTYIGEKPRTGVYYVFVTNTDGSEAKAGKFIINE